ncbi:MAG: hypothetical protein JSR45_04060 [Proteobacteria bacterium]|nr:hypothetical protein [Pseudomonadota bacterium]
MRIVLLASLSAFALLVLGSPAAPAQSAPLSEGCRAAMKEGWPKVSDVTGKGDWSAGLERLAPLEAACANDAGAMELLSTVHAEGDLRLDRPAQARVRLEQLPITPASGLYPTNRWVLLSTLEASADKAAFAAARDAFLEAHDAALSARMKRVEILETPTAKVWAYQGEILNGPFVRRVVFVAAPKDGGWPATLAITEDKAVAALLGGKGPAPLLIDLYNCKSQALVGDAGRDHRGQIDYAAARAKAEALFSDASVFQSFGKQEHARFCGFEPYLLPGFDTGDS